MNEQTRRIIRKIIGQSNSWYANDCKIRSNEEIIKTLEEIMVAIDAMIDGDEREYEEMSNYLNVWEDPYDMYDVIEEMINMHHMK